MSGSFHRILRVGGHVLDNPGNAVWQAEPQLLFQYLIGHASAQERTCLMHLRQRSSPSSGPLFTQVQDVADALNLVRRQQG